MSESKRVRVQLFRISRSNFDIVESCPIYLVLWIPKILVFPSQNVVELTIIGS